MKKGIVIEMSHKILVQCDTPGCDFKVLNKTQDAHTNTSEYINVACPQCGANLLTQEDYDSFVRVVKIVDWINKWFGWISYIPFLVRKKPRKSSLHVHNGVHFTPEEEPL